MNNYFRIVEPTDLVQDVLKEASDNNADVWLCYTECSAIISTSTVIGHTILTNGAH